jgi:hypothetical protein
MEKCDYDLDTFLESEMSRDKLLGYKIDDSLEAIKLLFKGIYQKQ